MGHLTNLIRDCKAILAPLALLERSSIGIDVRHLQRHDFGDPQSGAISGAQRIRFMARLPRCRLLFGGLRCTAMCCCEA
jgi:hypothetical protein